MDEAIFGATRQRCNDIRRDPGVDVARYRYLLQCIYLPSI